MPLCGGDVDGGAGGAAVLGALVVGDDLELGDGVRRDGDDLVVEALVAFAVGVVVDAVEQEVVEHAALAVDVVGAGADERVDGAGGRGGGGLAGAGDKAEEVGVVAADEREGCALIVGDGLAALAGLGFKLEGDVGDFDGGLGRAYVEGEVDALASADGDGDVVGDGVWKAGGGGGDGVNADAEGGNFVVAFAVGGGLGGDCGGVVGDGDDGVGNSCSALVANRSDDTSVVVLSVGVSGEE